jgi:hypothetical protein
MTTVEDAKREDEQDYNSKLDHWRTKHKDWEESTELAKKILSGDKESKVIAFKELNPFSEIANLVSGLSFSIAEESSVIEVEVHVHGNDIVPNEIKSILQSGRLSVKKMPKGAFNELYQDYVCICVLRVANEVFSIAPDGMTIVTAVDELLNSKTGHLEKSPILSVNFARETLSRLNMNKIDPSDAMGNFIHNMSFKKTTGFQIVNQIRPNDISQV